MDDITEAARLVADHDLWLIRLSSKSRMWSTLVPCLRAGLDDAAIVQNAYFQLYRLERVVNEILDEYPHLEPQVSAILRRI
ncbi:hypothetical protein RN01_11810 [Cupriavidus sp. SHE]|mgnify:CR=1 FL=1|jgi:hypothetical protein|uniref:Uncharacterized protein n=1 Tax=Cupriavidus metallidurans TaxID=119219 RepID=A0A482INH5_9BURK|nr:MULTISPECIES: hypothetical protein [Cupriavidus]KWR82814.1 hypothetical protein RN01_11810 [Cupriavidus sp. SHE]QBP09187.1 hypothetical protein DDF84_005130 [Cupriavidus metallidurans]